MPQEFLRDVLRTGDATNRARRRLSVLPISVVAHAVALTAFMTSPFFTAIEMPVIASRAPDWMPTVSPTPPPAPPPPRTAPEPVATDRAPIAAPDNIAPESPRRTESDQPGVIGGVDIGVNTGGGSLLAGGTIEAPTPPAIVVAPPPGPVRPGGRIREPRKILHVAPVYPVIAQNARKEGTVILEALLDVTGRVESVKVLRSVVLLDEAAIRAVQQWRYTPTELNGVPVPVLMTVTVVFSLNTR